MTKRDLPWVEKYRPDTLENVVGHVSVIATLQKFIENNVLPHLLFYGPPGTGKTTVAHAISKHLYKTTSKGQVLELNASDERGIDVVRETIKRFSSTKSLFGTGHKLIILDESDAMTNPAQAALRRIMEKFTSNVRFILICNYPEKIIPALRSRCTEFRFAPIPSNEAEVSLRRIGGAENLAMDDDGIKSLLKLGNGDLRRCINLMQTTALSSETVSELTVYKCAGYPLPSDVQGQLELLMNLPLEDSIQNLESFRKERGLSLIDILREIHQQFVLYDLDPVLMASAIDSFSQIERRIADGASSIIQSAAIAATFQELRSHLES